MGKVLALLPIILLAITSVVGYLFLNEKIIIGERQLDAAKLQLRQAREQLKLAKFALVACA